MQSILSGVNTLGLITAAPMNSAMSKAGQMASQFQASDK